MTSRRLAPPRLQARAEVRLGPRRDQDVAVRGGDVREGQRERRRAANHLAILVVLGAVAGAAIPVHGLVPGHDAAEVRADGADREVLDALALCDEVKGLTFQALHELSVAVPVCLHPGGQGDGGAIHIAGRDSASTSTRQRRVEVEGVAAEDDEGGDGGDGHDEQVHQSAALHVRHEAGVLAGGGAQGDGGRCAGGLPGGRRHEGAGEQICRGHQNQRPKRSAAVRHTKAVGARHGCSGRPTGAMEGGRPQEKNT
mmetsp:Transcript_17124/g.47216  ORF Transcript_17124/g.47216 Transcript_17124/m.47216 type:complete len:255 (+) Transcript_17124:384-1148(+)